MKLRLQIDRKKHSPRTIRRLYVLALTFPLLLILLPIVYLSLQRATPTSAAWFDASYGYRKAITFTHNASLSDRRVAFTVDTATLTTDKMQSDCDDSRFTDANGKLLNFQVVSGCDSGSTVYDVVLPTVINGSNLVYFYYGNPSAISASQDVSSVSSLSPSGGSASFASEEGTPGPIASWSFDEGTGQSAADSTSFSNDGQLGSGSGSDSYDPTWLTTDQCVRGTCLRFDGSDDYVGVNHQAVLNLGDTLTLSTWIKPQNVSTDWQAILNKGTPSNWDTRAYSLFLDQDEIAISYKNSNGWQEFRTTSANIQADNWTHVVYQRNASNEYIYVNGRVAAQGSVTQSMENDDFALSIGAATAGASGVEKFNGVIDEFKIYNYLRSAAQIQTEYSAYAISVGGPNQKFLSDGLVGYWKMDETSGNRSDSSGNSFTLVDSNTVTANPGKFGNSAQFTAANSESFSVANDTKLQATGGFTWAGWLYHDSLPSETSNTRQGIIRKLGTSWSAYSEYNIELIEGDLYRLTVGNGTSTYTATVAIPGKQRWVFLVAWYDSVAQTINIQVNNGAVSTSAFSGSVVTSTNPVYIGLNASGVTYMNGRIDELRFYKKVLSASERKDLYYYTAGPILHWQTEENSGSTLNDTSGNSNTGTVTNATWTQGKFGSGLNFDGTGDYVSRADDSDLDFAASDNFTIESWFKRPTASTQYVIVAKHNATAGGYKLYMESDGDITCGIDDDSTFTPDDAATSTAATYDDNQWHHVACVKTGTSSLLLYIDGVLVASDTSIAATGTLANADAFYWGINGDGSSIAWIGQLDELRIFNYARTANQVSIDYKTTLQSNILPVPALYWNLDEGSGTTARNSSPTTVNGTLTNAVFKRTGKVNGSVYFDGVNDYISAASSPVFNLNDGHTLTMWINPDTITNVIYPTVYNRNAQGSGAHEWMYFTSSILAYAYSHGTMTNIGYGVIVTPGVWQHLAVVNDRANRTLSAYINGKLVNTQTIASSELAVTSGTMYFGIYQGVNSQYGYKGYMDEIKMYNSALNPEQVAMDYNAGSSLNFGVASNENTQLSDGAGNPPVGYWPFDDNTGTSTTKDMSGNNNNGTLTGTMTESDWRPGKIGSALDFDGSDDVVNVGAPATLANLGTLTVSAWVKSSLDQLNNDRIVDKQSSNTNGWTVLISSSERVRFTVDCDGGTDMQVNGSVQSWQGVWKHIAVTWDGTCTSSNPVQIYINGVQDSVTVTAGTGSPTSDSTTSIGIGRRISSASSPFTGLIDEVILYDYVRTPSQILYDYSRGAPLAHLQFDECQGTTAYDASGNSYSGTLTVGASGSQTTAGTCITSSSAWGNGVSGKINSSLNFDGTDDYVALPDDILDIPTTGSICTWFYYDKASDDDTQGTLFSYADSSGVSYKHMLYISDSGSDSALIRLAQRTNTTSNKIDYNSANDVIRRQAWQHVCIVQDGGGVDLYLDGKPVTFTATLTGTVSLADWFDDVATDCENATIGVIEDDAKDSYFTGKIDDFRIYTYPLTQTQIRKIMQDGSSVKFGPSSGIP